MSTMLHLVTSLTLDTFQCLHTPKSKPQVIKNNNNKKIIKIKNSFVIFLKSQYRAVSILKTQLVMFSNTCFPLL